MSLAKTIKRMQNWPLVSDDNISRVYFIYIVFTRKKNPNSNITLFNFYSFLPLGPRICPGESLAKTEMFLVFSNLVQKFRFCKVSETDEFDLEGLTGITTFACPYRLKVEIR